MNLYLEWKKSTQEKVDTFKGLFFAFNDKQLIEGFKKIGLDINSKEDNKKVVSIGIGGFILKDRKKAFDDIFIETKLKEEMKDFAFAKAAFRYELGNYEYCITLDFEDTLEALDLTFSEVENNPMLLRALREAKIDYLQWQEDNN